MVFLSISSLEVCYMTVYVLQESGFTKPKGPFTSEKSILTTLREIWALKGEKQKRREKHSVERTRWEMKVLKHKLVYSHGLCKPSGFKS